MQNYGLIAEQIIKSQMVVVGPLAMSQAKRVVGLQIKDLDHVEITGDGKEVVKNLVNQFALLFGRASIEVCKDAVREAKVSISSKELPEILQ